MIGRIPTLIVIAGSALLAWAGRADAAPYPVPVRPAVMPGSDPRTWSPYPLRPTPVMPGSDPRTWSPYPLPGSDPRIWSPYPLYPVYNDDYPILYRLPSPNWRQRPSPYSYPYAYPYSAYYGNPTGIGPNDTFNLFR